MAYARVSTSGQQDNLRDQIKFIQTYANAKEIILDQAQPDWGKPDFKSKKAPRQRKIAFGQSAGC
ncbi:recombinase family protein [Lactobacillus sp. DCY120]|uniref:Recombinase family protein n=1 Tax=Bombilactobacillus apium TaxID=2675299 RepID=A0A850R9A2_9LACO|nr:recombinase family protein [Bombilactobacillus apium]NVY95976.1 recombinase family protein [Bombilactobacillus apium]